MARRKKDPTVLYIVAGFLVLNLIFGGVLLARYLSARRAASSGTGGTAKAAQDLQKEGRLRESEELLQKALENAPEDPGIYEAMGDLLMAKGHLQGAVFYYERALEEAPGERKYIIKLLLPYFLLGDAEKGIALLMDLARRSPKDAVNYVDIANMHMELAASRRADGLPWKEHLAAGEENLARALKLDSKIRGAGLVAAKAAILSGKVPEAAYYFEAALREGISDPALGIDLHAALGDLYLRRNEPDRAKREYEEAFSQFNKWQEVNYQRTLHNRELFLLVLDVYFGETLNSEKLRSFYPEYDVLLKRGIFPQLKEDRARGLFLALLQAREAKTWDRAIALGTDLNRNYGDPKQPQCFFHNYFFRPLFKAVTLVLLGDLLREKGDAPAAAARYREAHTFAPENLLILKRLKNISTPQEK